MVYTWWTTECVAEEGWFVSEWVKRDTLFAEVTHLYGPMSWPEVFDVLDAITTAWLTAALER